MNESTDTTTGPRVALSDPSPFRGRLGKTPVVAGSHWRTCGSARGRSPQRGGVSLHEHPFRGRPGKPPVVAGSHWRTCGSARFRSPRQRALRLQRALLTLLLCSAAAAAAQGPPPHVTQAVDAVIELLRERTDERLGSFVEEAVADGWRGEAGAQAVRAEALAVREALPAEFEEIAVEGAPGGVQLLLTSGGVVHVLDVGITEAGITSLALGQAGQVAAASAPPAEGAGRDEALENHLRALEGAHRQELDELVRDFEQHRFSAEMLASTTAEERRAELAELRAAAAAAGAALLDEDDGGLKLTLESRGGTWEVHFALEHQAPFALTALDVRQQDASSRGPELTWESAGAHFEELAAGGFSGVVHLARSGEVVLEKAYGMANRELAYPVTLETIFGIGSTPIDFTVAGIHLLAQRGELSLDDPIGEFFQGVPEDKRAMTVRHLITGASGLPDFHDLPGDWDADLAWIDRDEAVRRILAQPLLFAPGTSRQHSHSAYGLAAAILELRSGEGYERFLRREIFDPPGMNATGMYGATRGFALRDFAVGYGASSVGLPNIPPNWGKASWLVMGSGGMFSTLGDMLRFHLFMRSGELLQGEYARRYLGERLGVGGSDRGFYIFEALDTQGDVAMMILNGEGRRDEIRALSRALERLVMGE